MKVGGDWGLRALSIAIVGAITLSAPVMATEPRTPLMLKDGHISQVAVHVFRFAQDAEELTPESDTALAELASSLANGCFLTAQAIGHVEKAADGGEEALEAHRLARARADRVQSVLIDAGLPRKAIASVWDWQFTITEPRVTLWTFSLDHDGDCSEALVSAVPPEALSDPPPQTAVAAAPPPPPPTVATPPVNPPTVSTAATAEPTEDEAPTALTTVTEIKEPPLDQADILADDETVQQVAASNPEPATTAEPEIPAPQTPSIPEDAPVADIVPEPQSEPEPQSGPELAKAPIDAADSILAVETVAFDVNSSYFDAQTGRELRAILQDLPANGTYKVSLEAAVGTGDVKGTQTPEEAATYNRWIAERRMQRVVDWLLSNADGRSLVVDQNFLEQDVSRTVVVGITPAD
ncbi:MAG: OmpA family protein [Pseudomonadota bacterium]